MSERRYVVRVIRAIPTTASNAFDAAERALNLAQRQKEWPGKLWVQVDEDDVPALDAMDDEL